MPLKLGKYLLFRILEKIIKPNMILGQAVSLLNDLALLRNLIVNGLFLSDRIYWIYWIFFSFSQFPEENEKEESRYAGEMKLRCAFSMECHNTDRWFVPGAFSCRLWRHWVFVLPSPPASPERERWRAGGKDKRTTKILLMLSKISTKIN
jgi:hypothetical protein